MELSEAVRLKINNLIKERNLTVSSLCSLAGISRSTLSKFLSGQRKLLRLEIIQSICEGLDISLNDFFDKQTFKNTYVK